MNSAANGNSDNSKKKIRAEIVIFIINLLWILYILSPVFIVSEAYIEFNKLTFSTICHQIPDRSFSFNNITLPVCQRCFAIYAGAMSGAFIWLFSFFRRKKFYPVYRYFFVIAVILNIIEKGSDIIFKNPPPVRTITGFILGMAVLLLINDIIEEFLLKFFKKFFKDNN